MAVITVKAFTGSVKNRNYTGERFNIYINTLNPTPVQADAYGDPWDAGNVPIGIYITSVGKINTLMGGTASAIAVHKFTTGGTYDAEFNSVYVSYRRSERLVARINWENPLNGNILVGYSHWYTKWRNGDVTFENFEPDGSDVISKKKRDSGLHCYTALGAYVGELEGGVSSVILYIYPGETYSASTLYYIPHIGHARFSFWEQWDGPSYQEFGPRYFDVGGTPWLPGESHMMLYQNVGQGNYTIPVVKGKAANWGEYLFGNLGILPTIYWDGNYDKEIYYKGRYHKSGWLYENGQWTYAWERCPYEGFDN